MIARPCEENGKRNLIAKKLVMLRKTKKWSQRDLAHELQLIGIDMDKNVITRIETNKRYVTDIELKALTAVFDISYSDLLES
ncbi:MAG: helix-turn-helix transcriptional regulator [Ruthenibacterium sp.]